MTGKKGGVATKMCEKIENLFTWHCLCHCLELSVHDVIKYCTGVSRFQSLMDKLYAYYHQSPINSMGLDKSCVEVGIKMKNIGRILKVRWSASSFRTIKAIWNNYPLIYLHVSKACNAVSNGIRNKLESPSFLEELVLFYDVLSELAMLSCILQSRKTTLMRANS